MVKLTSDLVLRSAFYTNALGERELDLRGLRIPEIENLGATRDAFDCIDLSANDIAALANLPRLPRLTTLLLSGNRIAAIAADTLPAAVPNLRCLQLANNRVCAAHVAPSTAPATQATSNNITDNNNNRLQTWARSHTWRGCRSWSTSGCAATLWRQAQTTGCAWWRCCPRCASSTASA